MLWRRPGQRAVTAIAPLRLALAPQERRLAVRVLKRRGGELAQPVLIDIDVPQLPDPRTSRRARDHRRPLALRAQRHRIDRESA